MSAKAGSIRYRDLLRHRDVSAVLAAATFTGLSARMFALVVVLYALDRFHSPALAGWLLFASMAPGLIASPLAGAVLDRIGGPRAIAVDMAVSAVVLVLMAAAGPLHWAAPAALLILTAVYSLTSPLSAAGVRALLPRIVPPPMLSRVNGLDMAIRGLTEVVGPALGGLLFAEAGADVSLLVIAVLAVLAATCLLRLGSVPRIATRRGSILGEAVAGLAIVLRHPTLRALVACYTLYQAAWGVLLVVVPVIVVGLPTFAGWSDTATGLIWALAGVAEGIGALLTGQAGVAGRERGFIAAGALGTALAIWPMCCLGPAGLVAGMAVVGFMSGPADVGLLALRQRTTEPAIPGRVLAVSMSLNTAGLPVGSAVGGMLLGWGVAPALLAGARAAALGALLCWFWVPAEVQG